MDRTLAKRIVADMKTSSLRRLEAAHTYLEPLGIGYTPIIFGKEHFRQILKKSTETLFLFVDGGNAELVATPDYSLHFLRLAVVGYVGKKRVQLVKKEGYVLVQSRYIDEKLCFVTECYGDLVGSERFLVAADDPQLQGISGAPISAVGGMYRALLEIEFARENLTENSVLVMDRALAATDSMEHDAFTRLFEEAAAKGAVVCGLNKTTTLLCNTGESVVTALNHFGERGRWLYGPVFSSHPQEHYARLFFAKFHSHAKHIFRFEVGFPWRGLAMQIASQLTILANDALFIGYPYGLIAADRFARVSNREKEYLRTMFARYADMNALATHALDAHSILDSM